MPASSSLGRLLQLLQDLGNVLVRKLTYLVIRSRFRWVGQYVNRHFSKLAELQGVLSQALERLRHDKNAGRAVCFQLHDVGGHTGRTAPSIAEADNDRVDLAGEAGEHLLLL